MPLIVNLKQLLFSVHFEQLALTVQSNTYSALLEDNSRNSESSSSAGTGKIAMADYSFGGSDEENAELKKLNAEVVCYRQFSSLPFVLRHG